MSLVCFKEQDGTVNMIASGYVTREPKVYEKVVLFGICYNGKAKKYLDCKAWRNDKTGDVASRLEKHDEVLVCGVLDSYKDKEGNDKNNLLADSIFTVEVPGPVTNIFSAMEQNGNPDPLDSLGTKLQEYDDSDEDLPF